MNQPVIIKCKENGPLVVTGDVKIVDHEDNELDAPLKKGRIALCRCGHSKTKPFCDGSHRDNPFCSEPTISDQ